MNSNFIFKCKNGYIHSLSKYYLICLGAISASYFLVVSANLYMDINVILAKICIDILLGILSYEIQLHWVSKKNKSKEIENVLLEKKDEG